MYSTGCDLKVNMKCIHPPPAKKKIFDISILQSTGLDRLPSRERGTPEETSPPVAAEGKGR